MTNDQMIELGNRLQKAREEKRYSRSALAEKARIPMKSLEKYEAGTMDIPMGRLSAVAEALELEISFFLSDDSMEPVFAQNDGASPIQSALEAIDQMRGDGFEKHWRAIQLKIEEAMNLLAGLSVEDLATLAERRGVHEFSSADWLTEVSEASIEESKALASALEARVIDAAVFGKDLYGVEPHLLEAFAEETDLNGDSLFGFGWSCRDSLVNAVRPKLFEFVMAGKVPEFLADPTEGA